MTTKFKLQEGDMVKLGTKAKTLGDWRDVIADNAPYVDKKPYSHNIISIALSAIADRFGKEEANKAIRDFGLTKKGWREQP
jgi:hypothetical protein